MRVSPAALRFPSERVLLARTKLAYVHLQNLLTDAKRDRGARVFGYVVVWLPEELLLLYLQEGEVVAATRSPDGVSFRDLSIREALDLVPHAAEYGEVCFHTADDEQLACMYASQTAPQVPWPTGMRTENANAVLGNLLASTYDGMVEINAAGAVNFVVFRHGVVRRAYFADGATSGSLEDQARALWRPDGPPPTVRRWEVPAPLLNQASPALIDAYRGLTKSLTTSLGASGVRNAEKLVERARQSQLPVHPALAKLQVGADRDGDPVTTVPMLARAVGAWVNDVLWAVALPEGVTAEGLLRDLTRERRHLFQSAGFFDVLAWKVV